ncbi:MAG: hypothetical protein A2287_06390 [Candidatus Melainabacteria bacterium RIFOXYA12_FULL_32_12]|nr:MAG: hypothetical protein A2255_06870 [Candidatus Melainabacteria bacterium RIFOXYA2_FULL_32_9]OGI31578.1 MAG: hypothetical protein A2287_06390 [Candidatus Melainabacteria bacterium RIFOXYA12_FULL_32_12]
MDTISPVRSIQTTQPKQVQFKGKDAEKGGNKSAALASAFLMPGAGQLINGEVKEGVARFVGMGVICTLGKWCMDTAKLSAQAKGAGIGGTFVAATALYINGIIDAYKHKKAQKDSEN